MRVQFHKLLIGVLAATAVMTSGWTVLSIARQTQTPAQLPVAQVPRKAANKKAIAVQQNTNPTTNVQSQTQSPRRTRIQIVPDKTLVQVGEIVSFNLEPKQYVADSSYYNFVFHFDDGSAPETKDPQQPVRHRFSSPGSHTITVFAVPPPGGAPDEEGIDPLTIVVQHVKLSANPLSVEVGIPVSLQATSVSKDSSLRYRFFYDDEKKIPDWQESNIASPHAYAAVKQYQPKVDVGLANGSRVEKVDSALSEPVKVVLPPTSAVVFSVAPPQAKSGELVTLSAEFPAQNRHIQYRFLFGDGQRSEWQDESTIKHTYSAGGWYEASVDVGVVLDGPPSLLVSSAPRKLEVVATEVPIASPTETTERRNPLNADWPLYLIAILLIGVILTGFVAGTYKVAKWAFRPKPTFSSHLDVGTATMDHPDRGSLVGFEVDFNPNVAGGFYKVLTSEPGLVRAERSQL